MHLVAEMGYLLYIPWNLFWEYKNLCLIIARMHSQLFFKLVSLDGYWWVLRSQRNPTDIQTKTRRRLSSKLVSSIMIDLILWILTVEQLNFRFQARVRLLHGYKHSVMRLHIPGQERNPTSYHHYFSRHVGHLQKFIYPERMQLELR